MKFSYFLLPSLLILSQVGHTETLSNALLKCSDEKNSLKRLVCYDQLSDSYKQYEDVPQSTITRIQTTGNANSQADGSVYSNTVPQAQLDSEKEQLGLAQRISKEDREKKIYYTIKQSSVDVSGKLILTMDNGQVWYQTDTVSLILNENDKVYIERGALGSFFLSKDNARKRIRVKRRK